MGMKPSWKDKLKTVAEQGKQVADALGVPLHLLPSPYGHDGFLIEVDAVGHLLRELLG